MVKSKNEPIQKLYHTIEIYNVRTLEPKKHGIAVEFIKSNISTYCF